MYTELDTIEKESELLCEIPDVEDKIEEIERLLDYLEQIKRQLELISKSYNLDEFYKLHDDYFTNLVEEYKDYIRDEQQVEDTVKDLKRNEEYTSLMKKILEFEKMQEELAENLEDKKQELEDRDKNFDELQDKYINVERMNKELESLVYESENYLKKIKERVAEAVDITTKTQYKMQSSMKIFAKTFLLFSLMRMNPRPKANAITAVEAITAISLINNLLNPKIETRKITQYQYTDYSSMIENAMSNVNEISNLIQSGIHQVQDLRYTFEKEFSEYKDLIPDYKKLLESMDKMEKELKEREDNMHHVKGEMRNQLNKNNQKVLEYERLNQGNN